jgi:hypothetical protein
MNADKGRPQSRSVGCAGGETASQSYTREGTTVNKHTTEAFSIKYVGLDVHKETIAVAVADSGTAEPGYFGSVALSDARVKVRGHSLACGERSGRCHSASM